MRGIHIFEKPYYREIRPMRGRAMRGPPVPYRSGFHGHWSSYDIDKICFGVLLLNGCL